MKYELTSEDRQYIATDVVLIKEVFDTMHQQGHKKSNHGVMKMLKRIIERFKECRLLCCFCKYRKLCEISWWKR